VSDEDVARGRRLRTRTRTSSPMKGGGRSVIGELGSGRRGRPNGDSNDNVSIVLSTAPVREGVREKMLG